VGKSGSPAPKPMTGRPAAFRALAVESTASVAEGAMAPTRREIRAREEELAGEVASSEVTFLSWQSSGRVASGPGDNTATGPFPGAGPGHARGVGCDRVGFAPDGPGLYACRWPEMP